MKREALVAHLEMAERHVEAGKRHIERQRQIIDELDRAGDTTNTARELLVTFENMQQQHVADRDRLAATLGGKLRRTLPSPS